MGLNAFNKSFLRLNPDLVKSALANRKLSNENQAKLDNLAKNDETVKSNRDQRLNGINLIDDLNINEFRYFAEQHNNYIKTFNDAELQRHQEEINAEIQRHQEERNVKLQRHKEESNTPEESSRKREAALEEAKKEIQQNIERTFKFFS